MLPNPFSPSAPELDARLADLGTRNAELQSQIDAATQELQARKTRLSALSAEAEDVRAATQKAFQDKYKTRFADVNVAHALCGMPAEHRITILGMVYALSLPLGALQHATNNFVVNPGELGPISAAEEVVLAWLLSVEAAGAPKTVLPMDPKTKLIALRKLPSLILTKIAEEAQLLQAYLNVTLERELGNS